MKIAITGSTGFIGKRLLSQLGHEGHECIALGRSLPDDLRPLEGADAWVHLAGEPIASKRWSAEVKKRIYDSRIVGTRKIVAAIERLPSELRPKTLIAASAIGIYGDRGDETLSESSEPGRGFLSEVVRDWEKEALEAEKLGTRVVRIRLGVVLGAGGGALEKMKAVVLGSGKQWMSWTHLDDAVRFILFAIENKKIEGAYNLTSPQPVTNAEFAQSYGRATKALFTLPAPAFALKIALGEMSSMLLDSCRALPKRTVEAGFVFRYETLDAALSEVFKKS